MEPPLRYPAGLPSKGSLPAESRGRQNKTSWLIDVDPRVISIVGPTASGKTGLGIAMAKALAARGQNAEIINADAYQMYKKMDIGTAKATPQERAEVPHHLIDIIEPSDSMTAARFQKWARACIGDLARRGVRPILVGGSGLYARAAVDAISFQGTDPQVRQRLEKRADVEGPGILFDELTRKDPQAAEKMDPHNVRRTIRALEIIEITGHPYSASLPRYEYVIPTVQIGLDLSRDVLDARIDERTALMREAGLVEEARSLRSEMSVTARRALGYQQVLAYLDGEMGEDEAFSLIAQRTKRLARKQMGWFGRDPRIHWLDVMGENLVGRALAVVDAADAGSFDSSDFGEVGSVTHHLGDVA
ncbi:MAG: tRNA (adenosine(37)-N6)-dimethylallyltransferase MiaA [Bifidobacteriaceae bacterium]|nr:tRNA (adenosine(37)-N6)-dimethylallyltransferase MiaA [Bifidobacteriaceae bacterium]MCI1978787.1 tRNA (adenosine(37)-N6)-dimethylallyltransferase MiaA [Bifidobacteriaceae bacterium]